MQRAAKLWRSRDISFRTEQIYGSLVLLVLLYGTEHWPIAPSQLQRLEVSHHRCLCSILGHTGAMASAQRSFCNAHSSAMLAPASAAYGRGGWTMSCGCLVGVWHGKPSFGSLEAQGQLVHRQRAYAASCANMCCYLTAVGSRCMAGAGINSAVHGEGCMTD